ncbi:hypothetical protein EST38_g12904 [Candolleomyces aberdarensis]|uniref:Uncharacterized protein n=1 Tax=Candolleomyces aberdarensis TaxID=2316362 RepID=A0A4Q2D197_9AGAR|nr:hypothetical protein EST38_g12904 [Candolleomyces aberdarensis]
MVDLTLLLVTQQSHNPPQDNEGNEKENDPEQQKANLEGLQSSLNFVNDIRNACVSDSIFPQDLQTAILKPIEGNFDPDDPDVEILLTVYLSISNASEEVNRKIQTMVQNRWPQSKMFSYEQIRKKVQEFSQVAPIVSNMWFNSCVAYTSEFRDCDTCQECGEARFKTNSKGKQILFSSHWPNDPGTVAKSDER